MHTVWCQAEEQATGFANWLKFHIPPYAKFVNSRNEINAFYNKRQLVVMILEGLFVMFLICDSAFVFNVQINNMYSL